ncbi:MULTISPECIES: M20 family metallopeptidase [unclassified Bradyrhizobium]|uniref:M20 family metallopeptidase n=1 Tax=unclassified Bradyrhizobium TaxID=2631580 RepID=UPI002478BC5E|nr:MULTISPECIES: M20 family metallopeptidase [unclassified Bradyrhizobium]WGR72989.1 M20 family metallopeptidase [Bradyrhizobium sp. ISRA426]WGR77824.1 M20 family metallopeptidase [Bradyrhizobium sp. ISRA430]WGR88229.1 M20 family metallopeptidase [Bradyrhizobium sp. ISRA432]
MLRSAKEVWDRVDAHKSKFFELSDRIWDHPELNYTEFFASKEHSGMLASEGFSVKEALAEIPTAIMGEAGEGGPVIAILGEYDALPGLSQEAGIAEERPLVQGGLGHGCGHNLLGSASLLAAVAVKDWLAQSGLPGRVRYYGCPAEEGGSSKSFLVRAGAFDDADVAICWHPSGFTGVFLPMSLACAEFEFTFHGRAAHASVAPHLGRSALDAVELMSVGVNYMREHMPSSARIHYALVEGGGISPNVVQPRAVVRHLVRALNLGEMWGLIERVKKIAEGAALMTETRVEIKQLSGEANLVGNRPLEEAMHANLLQLGAPEFDRTDKEFAKKIQETFVPSDIRAAYERVGLPADSEPFCEQICPLNGGSSDALGSTDVGTVSWVVPTVQCRATCFATGTPFHSWQLVAQGKSPAAHKGITLAAKAMAGVAADVLSDPALLSAAKETFKRFRCENPFMNPIGPDTKPPLEMAS